MPQRLNHTNTLHPTTMKLTDVKGVGQSAAGKLGAAGITTVEKLAEIDLRQTNITGLSNHHIATLRDNAQKLLQAQQHPTDLTLVQGLGPSARDKLQAAGIKTIDQLTELDLRTHEIDGLSTDNLQKLKHNARHLTTD